MGEVVGRALVQRADVCAGPYPVLGLSDGAVLLAGEIPFRIGDHCRVVLDLQGQLVGCTSSRMDGVEFLNFMKEAHPPIRRVAFPDDPRHPQIQRAIVAGVVEAVLDQPWNSESLSRALLPMGL